MQESRRWRRLELLLLPLAAQACLLGTSPTALHTDDPPGRVSTKAAHRPSDELASGPGAGTRQAKTLTGGPLHLPKTETRCLSEQDQARRAQPAPLPKGTTVLHIGDSFAGALGLPLNRRLEAAGVRSVLKHKTSSYIPEWASSPELANYLMQYQPDLVLISLGANELSVPDPESRARTVQKLVQTLEGRPCLWIGVPLWEGARTALIEVIRENAAPCQYMDTNSLFPQMPRAADGIHPTIAAREEWADVVVHWLARHRTPTPGRPWAFSQ